MSLPTRPAKGYGPKQSRHCYRCSKKRLTHLFSGPIRRLHGMCASGALRVPVCQPCAVELYGLDHIEREIAMGRLSFKTMRTDAPTPTQLSMDSFTKEV